MGSENPNPGEQWPKARLQFLCLALRKPIGLVARRPRSAQHRKLDGHPSLPAGAGRRSSSLRRPRSPGIAASSPGAAGHRRVVGELAGLGFSVSASSVRVHLAGITATPDALGLRSRRGTPPGTNHRRGLDGSATISRLRRRCSQSDVHSRLESSFGAPQACPLITNCLSKYN